MSVRDDWFQTELITKLPRLSIGREAKQYESSTLASILAPKFVASEPSLTRLTPERRRSDELLASLCAVVVRLCFTRPLPF